MCFIYLWFTEPFGAGIKSMMYPTKDPQFKWPPLLGDDFIDIWFSQHYIAH
jgi:hypothetical protein